jgi:hypothetical protein
MLPLLRQQDRRNLPLLYSRQDPQERQTPHLLRQQDRHNLPLLKQLLLRITVVLPILHPRKTAIAEAAHPLQVQAVPIIEILPDPVQATVLIAEVLPVQAVLQVQVQVVEVTMAVVEGNFTYKVMCLSIGQFYLKF